MNFRKRVKSLRIKLKMFGADAFVTNFSSDLKYFVNFNGSNGVCIITKDKILFATDYRYEIVAKKNVVADKIIISLGNLFEEISKESKLKKINILVDKSKFSLENYFSLKKLFLPKKIITEHSIVEEISSQKDLEEIKLIKSAIAISEKVFYKILDIIKPGITENEIAAEITYLHKKYGADKDSFEPIVASGVNGAKPHAGASNKKIKNNEMITLDFGCFYKNYSSDITRTIAIGKPKNELLKIYNIVNEALEIGINEIAIGKKTFEIDKKSRDFIEQKGYGKFFKHSLGHGIGLQIHELPRISQLSKSKIMIGNVVTIEPGIYLPQIGGVRIEDDVLVLKNKIEVLTKIKKELIVL